MNMLEKFKENGGIITVSSLEVAKDFEKRHDHVVRDIENLLKSLEDLKNEGMGGVPKNEDTPTKNGFSKDNIKTQNWGMIPMFIESTYKAGTGKSYKYYEMTRDGFSLLAMRFTGKKALQWQMKYIEAFNLMEEKLNYICTISQKLNPQTKLHSSVTIKDHFEMITLAMNNLHMNEASKITTYNNFFKEYNLPTNLFPSYVDSKGELLSCTECLKRINAELNTRAFNLMLLGAGYLEERQRPSTHSETGMKKYKALTDKGLEFGENQVSPNNPKEVQPLYYADKFQDLYNKLTSGN